MYRLAQLPYLLFIFRWRQLFCHSTQTFLPFFKTSAFFTLKTYIVSDFYFNKNITWTSIGLSIYIRFQCTLDNTTGVFCNRSNKGSNRAEKHYVDKTAGNSRLLVDAVLALWWLKVIFLNVESVQPSWSFPPFSAWYAILIRVAYALLLFNFIMRITNTISLYWAEL